MNYHNINIQQINYFLAVAKHLNFTDASKSLYISQPTLSKQIALFEKSINAQLFARNKRSVTLTPAGALLYNKLGNILEQLDFVLDQAQQVSQGYDLMLNIGCLDGLATSDFLFTSVEIFREKYPNVQVSFEKNSFRNLRDKMINNDIDISFTLSFEIEGIEDLESREIWETSSSILLSSKHPMANLENPKLEDFKNEQFIMISREETPNGFDGIISICRQHGFTPKIGKVVPNIESLILCVESGLGVALVDTNLQLYAKSRLVKYPIADDFISVVAVWRKDAKNPAIELFTDMLL